MTWLDDCTNPDYAWGVVSHHLGNDFSSIQGIAAGHVKSIPENRREIEIDQLHMQLVGALYLVVQQMRKFGHLDFANRFQEILDMVANGDVKRSEVRRAIMVRYEELQ